MLHNKEREIAELKQELQQYKHQTEVKELKEQIKGLKEHLKQKSEFIQGINNQIEKQVKEHIEIVEKLEELYRIEKCVSIEATRDYLILQKVLFDELGMTTIIGQEHLPRNIGEQVRYLRGLVHNKYNDDICDGVEQITQGFKDERAKENKS